MSYTSIITPYTLIKFSLKNNGNLKYHGREKSSLLPFLRFSKRWLKFPPKYNIVTSNNGAVCSLKTQLRHLVMNFPPIIFSYYPPYYLWTVFSIMYTQMFFLWESSCNDFCIHGTCLQCGSFRLGNMCTKSRIRPRTRIYAFIRAANRSNM